MSTTTTVYSAEQAQGTAGVPAGPTTLELRLTLEDPQSRVGVRAPDGTLGRAEAVLAGRSWAAKHFWTEGPPGDQVTIFEFDEPLPAGAVLLRVPFPPR